MQYTKPFLKWPGGKFRLLDKILSRLPAGRRLVEPFAGSGAVFLNASHDACLVCDLNPDLIGLFNTLQRCGTPFIERCGKLFSPRYNTSTAFYRFRDRFNTSTDAEERAALFLYLNRHAYNGLVRYNASGKFNVPFGSYAAPYFPKAELQAFLKKCATCEIVFAVRDFRETFAALRPGDVVYGDPPYVPLSPTANFTTYAGNVFGPEEQKALAAAARAAAARGVPVLLSNHDTPVTRALYDGAQTQSFAVRRTISCNGAQRGHAPELLAVFP